MLCLFNYIIICFYRNELVFAPVVQHCPDPVRVLCLQFLPTYPKLCFWNHHRLLHAAGAGSGTGTPEKVPGSSFQADHCIISQELYPAELTLSPACHPGRGWTRYRWDPIKINTPGLCHRTGPHTCC